MGRMTLGVDIGCDSIKLALCKDGVMKKSAIVPMPMDLMKNNRITSLDTMGELLREALKKNRIRTSRAALVLPNELSYVRTVSTPVMNAEQLMYNIPFEFNDYIEDEPQNYIFDYAMLSDPKTDRAPTMQLMAVAAPKVLLEEMRVFLNKAGMKLVKVAPVEYVYISLIRSAAARLGLDREYCVLDLGYNAVRMFMYHGDRHEVTRVLEMGMRNLDQAVAENYMADIHLAHTYFVSNFEDCQNQEYCMNAYNAIAVELMRAVNFYRFSNPDVQLTDIWISGGGGAVPGLRDAISETLGMPIRSVAELANIEERDDTLFAQAVGITME